MTQQTWQYAQTKYPAIRRAMGSERVSFDDRQLEGWLAERFGAEAEDMENFMRSMQRLATRAAPIAQRALMGAASGAATGVVGGLPGIVAGAVIGGTAGAITTPSPAQTPSRAPAPAAPAASPAPSASLVRGVGTAARTLTARGSVPARLTVPNPNAAAQLLMMLSRPETAQALLGLLMNRPRVPVGNRQVPTAAFANALAEMATLAAEQAAPLPARHSGYYFHADGTPRCDLSDDAARAQLLFADLFAGDTCHCSARSTSL